MIHRRQSKTQQAAAALLFDDAGIHVVRKFLVNLGSLAVYSFVEGMITSLEAFVEVQAWYVRNKANLHYAPQLRHLTKPWIVHI